MCRYRCTTINRIHCSDTDCFCDYLAEKFILKAIDLRKTFFFNVHEMILEIDRNKFHYSRMRKRKVLHFTTKQNWLCLYFSQASEWKISFSFGHQNINLSESVQAWKINWDKLIHLYYTNYTNLRFPVS